jgi:L-alanine-DL-glutamate epimerase-like enolase superfamily enzyme
VSVAAPSRSRVEVDALDVSSYTISTDQPESDGTLEWDETTIVVVEVEAGGERGLGYTYADGSVAQLIHSKLASVAVGADAEAPGRAWAEMRAALRNAGQPGAGAMALSAVDIALWDLKARLAGVALADALPRVHDAVPIYGSGGFTSYSDETLREQLGGWADDGIAAVKMKVARDPGADEHRVAVAREAIGDEVELMVDANGAYAQAEALEWAERFAAQGIHWLEEPLSSDDVAGLAAVRERSPAGTEVAAGEYCWSSLDAARLLDAGAVDVLQADVTRCGGVTGMLEVGALAAAAMVPFSAHCAPAASAQVCCAMPTLRHLEYFHDHVRLEGMLFSGCLEPDGGSLVPDRSRPGLGIELDRDAAARFEDGS